MRNKTLILGPVPPPMGGQAIITEYVIEIIGNTHLINTNTINRNPLLANIKCVLEILFSTYKWSFFTHIYLSLSRGKLSSIKDLLVLLLFMNSDKKIIGHMHGNDLNYLGSRGLYGYFLRRLYSRMDTCIYVTEYQKKLSPLFASQSVVIPNAVCNLWENEVLCLPSSSRLLYVSLLMYSKGFFVLLDALVTLLRKGYILTLHVAGSFESDEFMSASEFKKVFLSRIDATNSEFGENTVVYHGEIKGENKKRIFEDSDIFVFPTFFKSESFGLVLVEAMLSGCVVVASNEPFFQEILAEGNYLFDKSSVDSLSNTLVSAIEREDIVGQKKLNIAHARSKFLFEKFEKSIINVFK